MILQLDCQEKSPGNEVARLFGTLHALRSYLEDNFLFFMSILANDAIKPEILLVSR